MASTSTCGRWGTPGAVVVYLTPPRTPPTWSCHPPPVLRRCSSTSVCSNRSPAEGGVAPPAGGAEGEGGSGGPLQPDREAGRRDSPVRGRGAVNPDPGAAPAVRRGGLGRAVTLPDPPVPDLARLGDLGKRPGHEPLDPVAGGRLLRVVGP